jgi:aminopeptidase N
MDIARTPTTPDGNPEMADAAVEPKVPPLIRREDYQPYAWLIPEVSLDFTLGLSQTRVTATLTVQRNAKAAPASSIRLEGDGIEPVSVLLDGEAINSWTLEHGDLIPPPTAS